VHDGENAWVKDPENPQCVSRGILFFIAGEKTKKFEYVIPASGVTPEFVEFIPTTPMGTCQRLASGGSQPMSIGQRTLTASKANAINPAIGFQVSQENAICNRLRTPRAAAVAGILFSIVLITSQLLV
jgi:hypothetical protein